VALSGLWERVTRPYLVSFALLLTLLFSPSRARAEKVLFKEDRWEVYSDGRVGGFASYLFGDGAPPQSTRVQLADGSWAPLHAVKGVSWVAPSEDTLLDPNQPASGAAQGDINMMRVRSGFVSNWLGFGVRNQLGPRTKVMAYMQIWAYIESESRQKNRQNPADVRQGYVKVESFWGNLLIGRTRCLFSRGATDIDAMYAHRWGVGFPNPLDSNGPTSGQIGFGVLGSGFSAGMVYTTPTLAGFTLDVGLFEPIQLPASAVTRTKYLRPEGELNFEQRFSEKNKLVLFANGAVQKVYRPGACRPNSPENPGACDVTAGGFGYGGRLEIGPVHLGVAGHRGKGLGLNYALESSEASADEFGNLRLTDGYYAQSQVAIGTVDVFAGAGITRVFLTQQDKVTQADPRDPTGQTQTIKNSIIKYQLGINAGAVYHFTPNLHINLDYFRAKAKWYLGEQQTLNAINGGMTFNW
jgi:hypothetical protein